MAVFYFRDAAGRLLPSDTGSAYLIRDAYGKLVTNGSTFSIRDAYGNVVQSNANPLWMRDETGVVNAATTALKIRDATGKQVTTDVGAARSYLTYIPVAPPVAPVNTTLPSITGPAVVDATNGLDIGIWTGATSYVINIYNVPTGGSVIFGPYNPDDAPPTITFVAGVTYYIEVTATGPGGSTTVRATTGFGPVASSVMAVIAHAGAIEGSVASGSATGRSSGAVSATITSANLNRMAYAVIAVHSNNNTTTLDGAEAPSNVQLGGSNMTLIGSITTYPTTGRQIRSWVYGSLHANVPTGTPAVVYDHSATNSTVPAASTTQWSVQVIVLENAPQTLIAIGDVLQATSATATTSYSIASAMPANVLALCYWGAVASGATADTMNVSAGGQTLLGTLVKSATASATAARSTKDITTGGSSTFAHDMTVSSRFGQWIILPVPK